MLLLKAVLISAFVTGLLHIIDASPVNINPIGNNSEIIYSLRGVYLAPFYDHLISRYIRYFGEWEAPAIDIALKLLDIQENATVFFDVGANIGAWSVPIGQHLRFRAGNHVYAFEAVRENYLYLCSNLALNGIINATAFNLAIGKEEGITRTPQLFKTTTPFNSGAVSLKGYENEISTNNLTETSWRHSRVVALDDIYKAGEIPCPDFIKMDIELHEIQALRGSGKLLAECKPILFLEMDCYATTKSIVLLLHSLGYAVAWTVAPQFYLDERTFQGRNWRDLDVELVRTIIIKSAKSLTAVPQEHAVKFFDRNEFTGIMVPIDIERGKFYLEEYNIQMCVDEFCFHFKQPKNEFSQTQCAGVEMDLDDVLYWQEITPN